MKTLNQYQKRILELRQVLHDLRNSPSKGSDLVGLVKYYKDLLKSITTNVSTIEKDSDRLKQAMISSEFEIDRAKQYLEKQKIVK